MKVTSIFLTFISILFSLALCAQTESSSGGDAEEVISPEEVNVYIPNAFTPNGDGLNDVFKPVINGPDLKFYELIVIDRTGGEVFHSTNPSEVWNGSVKDGFYYISPTVFNYFMKIQTVDGIKPLTYTGHVVLIR